MEKEPQFDKLPSFGGVVFVLAFLAVGMAISVLWLNIPVHITLVTTMVVASIVAMRAGYTWKQVQSTIMHGCNIAMEPMLILMLVGMLIGTWIMAGTVQTMIYYGLKILSPSIFLVAAALISAVTSIATGSSYTTGGTVGVALVGIGQGLGVPLPMVAGAVVTGAAFGDKMSPLSDSTNLSAAVAEANLFDHIKSMMYTTIPGLLIALIGYAILGLRFGGGTMDTSQINLTLDTLQNNFVINPFLLIPPILIIAMALKKVPAIPAMIIASFVGAGFAIGVQGFSITEVTNAMNYGYVSDTGVAAVDKLLSRGGIQSMMWTVSLGFVGLGLGGVLEKTRMLEVFLGRIANLVKSTGGLITTTIVSLIGLNLATASQYMAIIISGRMFIPEFKRKKLLPRVLSRTLEDAGTLFSPLVPWGLCGVFFAGTLGVPTVEYFPYAFLSLVAPVLAIIFAYTGFAIWYEDDIDDPTAYSKQDQGQSVEM